MGPVLALCSGLSQEKDDGRVAAAAFLGFLQLLLEAGGCKGSL